MIAAGDAIAVSSFGILVPIEGRARVMATARLLAHEARRSNPGAASSRARLRAAVSAGGSAEDPREALRRDRVARQDRAQRHVVREVRTETLWHRQHPPPRGDV